MDAPSTGTLLMAVICLVFLSAYFSASETAMMALNRYRLRHLAKKGHRGAQRAAQLLERPDRLLGVILIGNNFVNFSAASIATLLAIEILGESGVAWAPVICTFVFLIFAEVAPKTIAAAFPERVALPSSHLLRVLLFLFYPLVWLVSALSNGLLRVFGINHLASQNDHLSREELRTLVFDGAKIASQSQNMMLGVLDLDEVSVDDIMVPKSEIIGIDLDDDLDTIIQQLRNAQHTRLPVFHESIENIVGILHVRSAIRFLSSETLTKAALMQEIDDAYFVPENTSLQTQIRHFQKRKERIGMVVDEYGDIQGIVTLEDILEEIVGEFTTDLAAASSDIHPQEDGSFYVDGGATIRAINRALNWQLPSEGPKTLNGLITETLETIPEAPVCLTITGYQIEIIRLKGNMIVTAKLFPRLDVEH
ncbi:HlyC/CorC family transporter [Pseudomonadales bacterium]|nr:HlyC/CorC family transporter [Gammaproteobacteria bacterium]MDA7590947.1 HlyC/CorC family transporter [Pseudomonadales bacterium]MBT5464139.1 HlyC/CorC family transporter [Gammaproteobacteria bacterium]MBT6791902.1 HlyC/CorC family transporter [Gammaproteobacteria bacterium]MBT7387312.1 HlyC/CorC family transporter [Gammaproteobacteria bacterium]